MAKPVSKINIRKGQFGMNTGPRVHDPRPRKQRTRGDEKRKAIQRSKDDR